MKKLLLSFCILLALKVSSQNSSRLNEYAEEMQADKQKHLTFIKFKENMQVNESEVAEFINLMILENKNEVSVFKTDQDGLGFTHIKFNINCKGISVFNKLIIAHIKNGKLLSLNGDLYPVKNPGNTFSLTEKKALSYALKKVNAKSYKWENKVEEQHMREVLNQPGFTYYPKAMKVIFEKEGKYYNAYQFNIYAQEPLYRANVFVDASTGKILAEQSLICNIDVPGTAATKYSGTQTLTCDQNGSSYRLRETQRGLGVETYNMNNTTTYTSTDFTNTATTWTTVNNNQASADAHWGAESTYDFYFNKFNINSIDNAGYKLLSYVHYSTNYNNAFWDGQRMTYGDGNGTTFTILTALDVCGHEITHGLVSNTANFNGGGTGEADALNEAFADIFGTSIERYARPGNWDWIMGKDITPNNLGIRNLVNPKSQSNPDTYMGTYWDPAGEPHKNSTPCSHWFYILVTGMSGINDLNNSYNVTGIGNSDAEKIAYRALTVYLTPGTTYANARAGTIQAAKDLFGNCSNQVQQTANAWYAVGVGGPYSNAAINPDFAATSTNFCTLPASVSFNNTSGSGINYTWYFGDGATSTATNAVHNYSANGTYTVKLKATGCTSNTDSIIKNAYITVNAPSSPATTGTIVCPNSSANLSASGNSILNWYASPTSTTIINTGTNFTTPTLSSNATYYVVNTVTNAPAFGGITSTTASGTAGGNLSNAAQWLIFDVLQAGILKTVLVNAQAAGSKIVELRNSSNVVLNTISVNLVAGVNTVTLNFNLIPGTNYQLGLGSSTANLFRTNSGVAFPYNVGSIVNITSSSAGSAYYYWFYNWQVQKSDCKSPAVPVTASVNPPTNVTVTSPSGTLICDNSSPVNLSGNPAGGIFSGNGIVGNTFDASLTGNGTFTISYIYTDGIGCTNNGSISMQVTSCTGLKAVAANNFLDIYPNPACTFFTVKNGTGLKLNIADATGRIVYEHIISSTEEKINIESFSKGIYILSVSENGKVIKNSRLILE
ncbi:MAG: M4 family metallopeptidase [Bacteroidia bacterium]